MVDLQKTLHTIHEFCGIHNSLTITRFIRKLETSVSVHSEPLSGRPKTVLTSKNASFF